MLRKYVDYFTVCWDDRSKMVPIQVLAEGIEVNLYKNEKPYTKYVHETPLQAAMRENKVLVNVSQIMPEKDWGFQIGRGFWVQDGFIKANSLSGAREAILEILIIQNKNETRNNNSSERQIQLVGD